MANVNTLTAAIPTIIARCLRALRGFTVMPQLVNLDYGTDAKKQGATVDVPISSEITAVQVSPSNTPPDDSGITPTTVSISLDQWWEAPFFMSDKDLKEIYDKADFLPAQALEAVKSIANKINATIFAQYTGIYGFAGTPATTPFASDTSPATAVRKVLNNQLAPLEDRRMVLDPDAAANALDLRAFQDKSWSGNDEAIRRGVIGEKLGFGFFEDQVVPTHTLGAAGTALVDDSGAVAVGTKTIHMDGLTTKPSVGDIFTIAGDDQTYVVTAATDLVGTDSDVSFEPGLQVAIANGDGNEAVTFKATHVVNLGFHRDAFALAMRPLDDTGPEGFTGGNIIQPAVDPVTGLTLRLEISRQHKRTRWSLDALWGVKLVRPALACRLAG